MTRTSDLPFMQNDLSFVLGDLANIQDDLLFGSMKDDAYQRSPVRAEQSPVCAAQSRKWSGRSPIWFYER